MRKPIAGEKHHWFPKAMAKTWVDTDGKVSRMNHLGRSRRLHPSATGYVPDHHNILWEGGSPWDSTFEPRFDAADNTFGEFTGWLDQIRSDHPFGARSKAVPVSDEARAILAECLASLIVRSPRLRFLAEKWAAQRQVQWLGFQPNNVNQTAGGTLQHLQGPFSRAIRSGGKLGFLIATEGSFLFGDGLMTNLQDSSDLPLSPMAMTAITPHVAVMWFSPSSCWAFPKAVSVGLSGDEVTSFNEIVQGHSRSTVFYIGEAPVLTESFKSGEHQCPYVGDAANRASVVDGWQAEILEVFEPG